MTYEEFKKADFGRKGKMLLYSTANIPRGRALFADLDNNYFVVTNKELTKGE